MTEYPNQEARCLEIRSRIAHLSPEKALEFGLRCATHVARYAQPFTDFDMSLVAALTDGDWSDKSLQKRALLDLMGPINAAQVKASETYDLLEGMKDLDAATENGIRAFQGDSAASAITNAILGVDPAIAHLCASWAATLAWAATMFDMAEAKWQEDLLSKMSDCKQQKRGGAH